MTDHGGEKQRRRALTGASIGTLFEWYDFNLYVLLAIPIGRTFFSQFDEGTRTIFALLLFAAGFLVRPLGAIFFGRLSDKVGRKRTFLITVVIMGVATILVGVLPGYETWGWSAAVVLVVLRMAQGFAVGGEYAGAAVYLAEHVEPERRGLFTSVLQATITLATLLALVVLMTVRSTMSDEDFMTWGWRAPFVLAVVPLILSVWIRLKLLESPAFLEEKAAGTLLKSPLRAVLFDRRKLSLMLITLFGLVAGQAVLSYGGQAYPFIFMQTVLKLDFLTASILQSWALAVAVAGFIFFGWLSDVVGRKTVIVTGLALGVVTYFPLFDALTKVANPPLAEARARTVIVVGANEAACTFQFNPVGQASMASECDRIRAFLISRGASFTVQDAPSSYVEVNEQRLSGGDPDLKASLDDLLTRAGYPVPGQEAIMRLSHPIDALKGESLVACLILSLLAVYASMVYAPLAAILVELFPVNVRTTAMSLPYNIGNGWIGGLLPATSTALVFHTGDIYAGLWYPVGFALLSLAVCLIFVPETYSRRTGRREPG